MKIRMPKFSLALLTATILLASLSLADDSWKQHVSEADRERTNPVAGGADALGRRNKPNLRTDEVQNAADGEIFWLLRNGSLRRGMPSWSALPEPSRWQIIAYVKSLGKKE